MNKSRSEILLNKKIQTKIKIAFPGDDAFNLPNGTPFQLHVPRELGSCKMPCDSNYCYALLAEGRSN